ncbi:MAG: CDP-diacylglycerol--glycerol-3-phosphate 3-phosphatidyltransferase [Ruminococcaceae bacterium]|nr:CDP-diacylglycerol--glycerol-3-phosphate 3-phosphatidyltransferase [Oscillospiraceae bacterium]
MNLPNKLTILRVLLVPVFMLVLLMGWSKYIALGIFIIASLTDLLDGHIARKHNLITDFGKFMDPLADKLLVISAMLIFVQWGQLPSWLVMTVLAREFAVSGLRMIAASKGTVMAAGMSGKIKTAATMICIVIMLTPLADIAMVNAICGLIILVTTVYSGVEYFVQNGKVLK